MPVLNLKEKLLQYGSLSVILMLAILIAYTLKGFTNAFLGAIIVYVLFRNVMLNLTEHKKWKKTWAAISIILFTFIIVLVPLTLITIMFIPKLNMFFDNSSIITHAVEKIDQTILETTGVEILSADNIKNLQSEAAAIISNILSSSINVLGQIAIMYFVLYFMLLNTGRLEIAITKYLPIKKENLARFAGELKAQTFSNVIGSPFLALIQGVFAALGYWIFGLPEPVFWGLMTGFFSFVPFVGCALIWLPASLLKFSEGDTMQAIGIVIYGILVIGTVDNIFRFILQKKFADVSPLITVLGIIVGFNLFGLLGLIFGPLMLSYLIIMFQIYKEEYIEENTNHEKHRDES